MNGALEQISVGRDVLAGCWKDATELIDYRNLTLNQAEALFAIAFVDRLAWGKGCPSVKCICNDPLPRLLRPVGLWRSCR